MANQTVLISGAGIGGPALAFWLRRYGFAPTVVEVAATPHSRVMPRADGTGSPGRSSPVAIRARISSAMRRYGG